MLYIMITSSLIGFMTQMTFTNRMREAEEKGYTRVEAQYNRAKIIFFCMGCIPLIGLLGFGGMSVSTMDDFVEYMTNAGVLEKKNRAERRGNAEKTYSRSFQKDKIKDVYK